MTVDRIVDAITHPLTVGLAGLFTLAGISKGGLIWATVATFWAQAGGLFGAASVTLFASQHIALPGWAVTAAALIGVVAFPVVAYKALARFLRGVRARTE